MILSHRLSRRLLLAIRAYVACAGIASLVRLMRRFVAWLRERVAPGPPKLTMGERSPLAPLLRKHAKVLTTPYHVTPWLWNGVVQTLGSMVPMWNRPTYSRRETIELPELKKPKNATCCPDVVPRGIVSVDWLEDGISDESAPIVIIVPGLTGHSHCAISALQSTCRRYRRQSIALHATIPAVVVAIHY